ncbi:dihydrodipicolinate reductase [Enterococcus columbae DSM 7374 = ATCC 51263]|nr:dihydrodipicolinate reductase [Enterococcus columbae DSM 7374 = ATCC 51263]
MGQALQRLIAVKEGLTVVAGVDKQPELPSDFPVYTFLSEVKEAADVVIDFSHFSAVERLLTDCKAKNLPVVVATTGLDEHLKNCLQEASEVIPVFYSANMSLGINVLIKALQAVTPILEEDFDIEMIEKHHNQKKDAPSGTALLLADSINAVCQEKKSYVYDRTPKDEARATSELGISVVRGGTIPGEHIVIYAGEDEILEFKHTALSRNIFAKGALQAAVFLAKQPAGQYQMADLVNANNLE